MYRPKKSRRKHARRFRALKHAAKLFAKHHQATLSRTMGQFGFFKSSVDVKKINADVKPLHH